MNTITEILNHITKVCKRNTDGSLTLGSYEIGLLEKALALSQIYISPKPFAETIFSDSEDCDEDTWSEGEDWSHERSDD